MVRILIPLTIITRQTHNPCLRSLAKVEGLFAAVVVIIGTMGPHAQAASADVSYPFQGVIHYHYESLLPRQVDLHVLEIDLTDPSIGFKVTPSNGGLAGDTLRATTRSFVAQEGAQIGINGSFYSTIGSQADVLGLSVSNGTAYSPFYTPDGFSWPALNIGADLQANVVVPPPSSPNGFIPFPNVPLYNAIGGGGYLVRNGMLDTFGNDPNSIHPRTAVGITADNKLLMLTVDGRNPGHSDGMRVDEVARYLLKHGAVDAINLDGGGSTTLVMSRPTPSVVNVPSDGSERLVANNLAVFAAPSTNSHSRYVYADFEFGDEGPLDSSLAYSSQTNAGFHFGLSHAVATQTKGADGDWSQRLSIINDTTHGGGSNHPDGAWFVRHVVGQGEPQQNVVRSAHGYVGFWAKTSKVGLQAALAVDDATLLTGDRSLRQTLIADNQWHLYQWNLADAAEWEAWDAGDGVVQSTFTLDSIQLFGSPGESGNQSAVVYLDRIEHNAGGAVGVVDAPWDGGVGNLWRNPLNWARDHTPTVADNAHVGVAGATVLIDASTSAVALELRVGNEQGPTLLDVVGGSLTVGKSLTVGYGGGTSVPGANATMQVQEGHVSVATNLTVGSVGAGRLEMTGGKIEVGGNGVLVLSETADEFAGAGHLQLDGGTIIAPTLVLNELGSIDISGGELVINSVAMGARLSLAEFISDGFITAYGGAGMVLVTPDLATGFQYRITAAIAGDFNTDGRVDGADFLMWQRGESPQPLSPSDLDLWQSGFSMTETTWRTVGRAVPEPSCILLAWLWFCAILVVPRRARSAVTVSGFLVVVQGGASPLCAADMVPVIEPPLRATDLRTGPPLGFVVTEFDADNLASLACTDANFELSDIFC